MQKLLIAIVAALALGASVSAMAQVEIAGNVTLASDYRFRGISQLEGEFSPAIQGGFDLNVDNGLYAGVWASNVNFTGGAIETDLYAGWANDMFNVGFIYYAYPEEDDQDLDYFEVQGSVSFWYATVGANYSDDYYAESGEFIYLYGDLSYPLNERFTLDAHLGWNIFDEERKLIGPADEPTEIPWGSCVGTGFMCDEDQYLDWSLGVTAKDVGGVDISLTYVGIDADSEDFIGTWAVSNTDEQLFDDTVVLAISKSL
jgi:uncharacterized protein (TIGR02001 family)